MKTNLITIPTDTIPLDGAWYEPEGGAPAGAALLFHGNTMNFYVGAPRFLPPALTKLGYACLAFNRRAARDHARSRSCRTATTSMSHVKTRFRPLFARGWQML